MQDDAVMELDRPSSPPPTLIPRYTQYQYETQKPCMGCGQRIHVVPNEDKTFVRVSRHTIMSGLVHEYSSKFEMREGTFGNISQALGCFTISSSRDSIFANTDFSGEDVADRIAGFAKALECAYADHIALRNASVVGYQTDASANIKIEVRIPDVTA